MQQEYNSHGRSEDVFDRSFGLIVGAVLALIGGGRLWTNGTFDKLGIVLLVLACLLIVLAVVHPSFLSPLIKACTKPVVILFRVVSPLIMLVVYVLTILPIGLLLRLSGKDPLRLKLDPTASSYWIDRNPDHPSPESMKNQF